MTKPPRTPLLRVPSFVIRHSSFVIRASFVLGYFVLRASRRVISSFVLPTLDVPMGFVGEAEVEDAVEELFEADAGGFG